VLVRSSSREDRSFPNKNSSHSKTSRDIRKSKIKEERSQSKLMTLSDPSKGAHHKRTDRPPTENNDEEQHIESILHHHQQHYYSTRNQPTRPFTMNITEENLSTSNHDNNKQINNHNGGHPQLEYEQYGDGDDEDGDDDDVNDLAPLIGGSSLAFEIEDLRRRRRRPHLSWCRSNFIPVAVFIIAVVVLLPAIAGFLFFSNRGDESRDVVWIPGEEAVEDALPINQEEATCDIRLLNNQTFDELTERIMMLANSSADLLCEGELLKRFGRGYPCECSTEGAPMINAKISTHWEHAYDLQRERVAEAINATKEIDVALLGDSITEHWLGTDLGRPSRKYENVSTVFKELFTKQGGSKVEGIVLGIAAERCRHLLYRLQDGVLGESFSPKVFWLLIGTNDLGGEWCNVDAIVAGNIAIVEELLKLRPDTATIVINSLLPRSNPLLWKYELLINERLECYANVTEGVEFFDASDIFMMSNNGTLQHLEDGLHPNVEGHRLWGTAIVEKVLEIVSR
jgi:lysophospholipase L1-like esterase